MPFTRGFSSDEKLQRHFQNHKGEFGVDTPDAYLALADNFLGGQLGTDILTCTRENGDVIRYNPSTKEYGVLDDRNFIVTYMRLNKPTARDRLNYYTKKCAE